MVEKYPETVQTAVRLPREMHERLKGSDLGVSEEIRQRVARSFFEEDATDAPTRELAEDIVRMAADVRANGIEWHRHPKAHEAFTAAIVTWLEIIKPPPSKSAAFNDLFGPTDPQTLGQTVARAYQRAKPGIKMLWQLIRDPGKREPSQAEILHALRHYTPPILRGQGKGDKS